VIIAATGMGIAVIGLVIAITIAPGASSTSARWAYTTGEFNFGPAVAGGTVYVGGFDGKVYALDAGS
jgi:eukaryotic-like serine/threonine-protein kinase